jgi:MFS family permease
MFCGYDGSPFENPTTRECLIATLLKSRPEASGRPRLVTPLFFLITCSTFAYFVAVGALIPILPLYAKGPLAGSEISVGMVIGAFALAAVILRPIVGRISDRRGRRVLIVGGAGVVAASTAAYVVADSLTSLIALRMLTGAGEAAFYVGAATVINDIAPDERRGEALSFFSLALFAGLAIGPVVGEIVLAAANFAAAWLVSAASAAIASVLGIWVSDTRPETHPSEKRAPLIHPAGLLPGAVLGTIICGLAGYDSFVPLYALDLGLDGSRLVFVVFSVIVISIRLFGARLPDRLGRRRMAGAGLTFTALGFALIAAWATPAGLFAGTAIFAVGHALSFPSLMSIAVDAAPPAERGAVVGTFTMFFDAAFGLGAVGLGAIAELVGYRGTFLTGALFSVGGLLLLIVGTRRAAGKAARRTQFENAEGRAA